MSTTMDLPDFTREQFALTAQPKCDLILEGGISSGFGLSKCHVLACTHRDRPQRTAYTSCGFSLE